MSVYVYEYRYVCRVMSGICVCTHVSIQTYIHMSTCVFMHNVCVQTSPQPQRQEGRLTLCRALPVCQQMALSVSQDSHTASACSFRNSAVMASPGSGQWKSDSQHLSQPEPASALKTSVCQAVVQADRYQAVLSLVTVTVFALPNQGESICSPLHSCSVPQFTAEHIWLLLQR